MLSDNKCDYWMLKINIIHISHLCVWIPGRIAKLQSNNERNICGLKEFTSNFHRITLRNENYFFRIALLFSHYIFVITVIFVTSWYKIQRGLSLPQMYNVEVSIQKQGQTLYCSVALQASVDVLSSISSKTSPELLSLHILNIWFLNKKGFPQCWCHKHLSV